MKFSDIPAKIRSFFQPSHDAPPADGQLRTLSSPGDIDNRIRLAAPGGVEIRVPDTDWKTVEADLQDGLPEGFLDEQPQFDPYEALEAPLRNWDGKSVRDIPIEPLKHVHELSAAEQLRQTVPAALRELAAQAVPESGRDSREWRQGMQILAFDSAGEALVADFHWNSLDGQEGIGYRVVSMREAIAQFEQYRGLAIDKDVLHSLSVGLPAMDKAQQTQLEGEAPKAALQRGVERAEPGQTYRGPMSRIEGNTVYQDINATTSIAHDVRSLLGSDVTQLLGKDTEVRYPHGQVGLVQAAAEMNKHISPHEFAVVTPEMGESARSVMER